MDKPILILISLLTFLVLVLSIMLALLIYYIFREKLKLKDLFSKSEEVNHSENGVETQYFCQNHPDDHSTGVCAICERAFCKNCLKDHENLHFCFDHYELFMEKNWMNIITVKANPQDPTEGSHLYQLKGQVWRENNMPTYIVTHYKINFENDFVESYVMLFGKEEDEEFLKRKINLIAPMATTNLSY